MTKDEFTRLAPGTRVFVTCYKPNPQLIGMLRYKYRDRHTLEMMGLIRLDNPPKGFSGFWEVAPEWIEKADLDQ